MRFQSLIMLMTSVRLTLLFAEVAGQFVVVGVGRAGVRQPGQRFGPGQGGALAAEYSDDSRQAGSR